MKKIFILFLFVFTMFLSGCSKEKPAIFFSSSPINKQTFAPEKMEKTFRTGQKIYFLVYYPKGFTTNSIRLQFISKKDDVKFFGIDIVQVRDISVKPGNCLYSGTVYLYKDSIYYLRVFSPDNWEVPLVQDYFYVRNR